MSVIRNRKSTWEKETRIKSVLSDVQKLRRLCEVLELPAEYFADIVYFVLDQFPVAEGQIVAGDVTDEWIDFEEGIPDYSIEEFYTRIMRPCNFMEEDT